jgi:hypothetical protein
MNESTEGAAQQEKENTANMNNFYLNLPGGGYRALEAHSNPERKKIMDAIDQLLKTEFLHLDIQAICLAIDETGHTMADALNRKLPPDEYRKIIQHAIETSAEAREKIRPLFNRMVELGFDPELLAR